MAVQANYSVEVIPGDTIDVLDIRVRRSVFGGVDETWSMEVIDSGVEIDYIEERLAAFGYTLLSAWEIGTTYAGIKLSAEIASA